MMMYKKILINCFTLAVLMLSGLTASFASEDKALDLINVLSKDTLAVIADDKISADIKEQKLVKLFEESVDTKWIAKFVLGKYWSDVPQEKQNIYTALYHKFLLQSYVPKFKSYTDQKIEILDSSKEYENEYLVRTEIKSASDPVLAVNYKVRLNQDGSYKIFDIVAEGVSMITTQRSEFSSILSRQGVDHLIEQLEKRTSAK
jgi:phospholipid transport system substrate-binding protein